MFNVFLHDINMTSCDYTFIELMQVSSKHATTRMCLFIHFEKKKNTAKMAEGCEVDWWNNVFKIPGIGWW